MLHSILENRVMRVNRARLWGEQLDIGLIVLQKRSGQAQKVWVEGSNIIDDGLTRGIVMRGCVFRY